MKAHKNPKPVNADLKAMEDDYEDDDPEQELT
jgi:hypothetical protein